MHQRNGEDVTSYMSRFTNIAERINPGLADPPLCGAFIQGLSTQIRRKIQYNNQPFKDVIKFALLEEHKLKKIALEDKLENKTKKVYFPKKPYKPKLHCEYCGRNNHTVDKCRDKVKDKEAEKPLPKESTNKPMQKAKNFEQRRTQSPGTNKEALAIGTREADMLSVKTKIGNKEINALLDTGSLYNFVDSRLVKEIEPMDIMGKAQCNLQITNNTHELPAYVVKNFQHNFILGTESMAKLGVVIDVKNNIASIRIIMEETITLAPKTETLLFISVDVDPNQEYLLESNVTKTKAGYEIATKLINPTNAEIKIYKDTHIADVTSDETESEFLSQIDLNKNLNTQQQEMLRRLLLQHKGVFGKVDKNHEFNYTKHSIDTGDHQPIHQRSYRTGNYESNIIKKELDSMTENNIIRPSNSAWSSPVVLIKKKDNTIRFCVDLYHG